MHANSSHHPRLARLIFPALLGFVVGTTVQLQQSVLYVGSVYGYILLMALAVLALLLIRSIATRWRSLLVALALGLLAFGVVGLRASVFVNDALDAGLEGRDIVVTGVVAAMPQQSETGLRFRFDVTSAALQNQPVHLPDRIELSWYSRTLGGAAPVGVSELQPPAIKAGERWQFSVRLKAPHGGSNPFGFDYELWL